MLLRVPGFGVRTVHRLITARRFHSPTEVYVTNAVKHFKWSPDDRGTGTRRLHEKPSYADVQNCFGWLETEIKLIKPTIVVLLGATAGQSLFGAAFRLVRSRGRFFETPFAPIVIATYHPSAVLRAVNDDAREATKRALLDDLTLVTREWGALEQAA